MNPDTLEIAKSQAISDLQANYTGEYYAPHKAGAFMDEWLWDDCFIAIGLSNLEPEKAADLLTRLPRYQHASGMFANQIIAEDRATSLVEKYNFGGNTSGFSQPPMVAEATLVVAQRLPRQEGQAFLEHMYPSIVRYHQWLFREREINGDGLVTQIHPYETGMDNTPPQELRVIERPLPMARLALAPLVRRLTHPVVDSIRRDFRHAPREHRMHNESVVAYQMLLRRLKKHNYDMSTIARDTDIVLTEDLAYNAIFARANSVLETIADELAETLPEDLTLGIKRQREGFEGLWSERDQMYYSRDARTKQLIPMETVASLLPLYSGIISKVRADQLIDQMLDGFWEPYPLPGVPRRSPHHDELRYWAGPAWEWINYLVGGGAKAYDHPDIARELRTRSLYAAALFGISEYRRTATGEALGTHPFSGAAAMIIEYATQYDRY